MLGSKNITFLIGSLECGGAENQLILLANGLAAKNYKVQIITFYQRNSMKNKLDTNIKLISLGKNSKWGVINIFIRLIKQIKNNQSNFLYSFLPVPNIFSVLVKPFIKIKIIWGIRASNLDLSKYGWLATFQYWLASKLSRFADLIIVNSDAGYEYHIKKGYLRNKLKVVYNGVDTSYYGYNDEIASLKRSQIGINNGCKLVGMVARIDPIKDHATFLKAAAEILAKRRDVKFVCIGGGSCEYLAMLKRMADELLINENVIWAGTQSDVLQWYCAMDVAVLCSLSEGFPNAVCEAMAVGIPVIATNVGDIVEIIGDIGKIIPKQDHKILANAILEYIDLPAEQVFVIRKAARERMQNNFSVDAMVQSTLDLILAIDENKLNQGEISS